MIIREAGESDLEKVARLWFLMAKELAPSLTPDMNVWKRTTEGVIKAGAYSIFVADDGGKLVGFSSYMRFDDAATGDKQAIGQHIYVLPEFRKLGISGILYRKVMKSAKINGCKNMMVDCMQGQFAFWMAHGFIPFEIRLSKPLG